MEELSCLVEKLKGRTNSYHEWEQEVEAMLERKAKPSNVAFPMDLVSSGSRRGTSGASAKKLFSHNKHLPPLVSDREGV